MRFSTLNMRTLSRFVLVLAVIAVARTSHGNIPPPPDCDGSAPAPPTPCGNPAATTCVAEGDPDDPGSCSGVEEFSASVSQSCTDAPDPLPCPFISSNCVLGDKVMCIGEKGCVARSMDFGGLIVFICDSQDFIGPPVLVSEEFERATDCMSVINPCGG